MSGGGGGGGEGGRGQGGLGAGGGVTEQELVKTLTEYAHQIASQVLRQPTTGLDLGMDAKVTNISL